MVELVSTELAGYDSTLLLDATQADMTVMLANEHVHRDSLSRAEAKLVGKYLRKVMGHPVDTFCHGDQILSCSRLDTPQSTDSLSEGKRSGNGADPMQSACSSEAKSPRQEAWVSAGVV